SRSSPRRRSRLLLAGKNLQPHLLGQFPHLTCQFFDLLGRRGADAALQLWASFLERLDALRRLPQTPRKVAVLLGLANQRLIRACDRVFLVADQANVTAGANMTNRSFFNRRGGQNSSHFKIVGDNQAAISDLFSENIRNPFSRQRSGSG